MRVVVDVPRQAGESTRALRYTIRIRILVDLMSVFHLKKEMNSIGCNALSQNELHYSLAEV